MDDFVTRTVVAVLVIGVILGAVLSSAVPWLFHNMKPFILNLLT